jgi:PGF-CTERM protein
MKSITKVMVVAVALLFVASMFVAPAAARGATINVINPGDTIFVYEQGLDLTAVRPAAGAITALNQYVDDDPTKALLAQIPVAVDTNFDVLDASVADNYGIYYADDGVTAITAATPTVTIREPTVSFDVVLAAPNNADSIDGKTVTKASQIAFKIQSPYVGSYYKTNVPDGYATVNVELTTPGGGKLTNFGTVNLAGLTLDSAQFYTDAKVGACVLTNVEAGTYAAQAKWASPAGFSNFATDSNSVSFTVASQLLTIESNKDNVIRGNNFVVTISGESKAKYYVYIKDAAASAANQYPQILPGQPGVALGSLAPFGVAGTIGDWADYFAVVGNEYPSAVANPAPVVNYGTHVANEVSDAWATVTVKADGTRPIEWFTTQQTDDRSFTLKVIDPTNPTTYDTVKVKVEKGAITVTASGDQSYYLGEEVTFSGTNTDSSNVYLFITGPNLAAAGAKLDDPINTPSVTGNAATFVAEVVETDDTWEYKWDTAFVGLDAGTYTVYAVSQPNNKDSLTTVKYETVSVVIKKPFVSATTSASTVAKGDKLFITGTAEGNPTNGVAVWVLGKNYAVRNTETVEDDGTFSYELSRGVTAGLASGQYFVVVQHPMYNDQFDITTAPGIGGATDVVNVISGTVEFVLSGQGSLQGSDAAEALVQAINSPNIDDTYTKLTFLVEEPWIQIDAIGDKFVGDTFTITGTTNLAVDDDLLVEVVSSSFQPTEKTQSGEFSGSSGTVAITKGDTYNTWSYDVDASTFKPDEYIVKVESIEADTTATATFNVLAGGEPTVAPTGEPTVAPTGEPTEEPTEEPTAAPTEQPGFGAFLALIGLGAVAVLVLRKH